MAFEFHISRAARLRYEFDRALFRTSGNAIVADFPAVRAFAARMNERVDRSVYPDRIVHAGELNAMGLIDEICHYAVELYRRTVKPDAMTGALAALTADLGAENVDALLVHFVERFPPSAVFQDGTDPRTYLDGETEGKSNREIVLEELLMLWLANANPAFGPFVELFDDADLAASGIYDRTIAGLTAYFERQPPFGPENLPLVAFLRAPAIAEPNSLAAQLRYMRARWGLVMVPFLDRLILSLDVLHEEEVALWMRMHPSAGDGGGGLRGPGLGGVENEYERFSTDRDWMPRVVLMAKTTYVWLDQLSKRYGRWIRRLDEIPDEELETLARRGFTGLWLIGLWERSRASQRIKQWRGNPEAAASAYSLMDYSIADELGGEDAYRNLRDRCAWRGIRLSSDMVPNHMGIDSRWVVEHPDWFLSLGEPPYPSYSFTGGNVGDDDRVLIQIEDHYWSGTDAAVVFKRTDTHTGDVRYVYHGNDGTSMPWNDTAQLDYLRADVREAVIQTILHVARRFPIIRFDAAMTLARRHIQRLWFPEPGQGGAIPSRAEHAVTRDEFDRLMPHEFWREVVDRVALEAPDTLLLAEAFWLLEGYFVRTLGMHRVYNSAFMNMLRDEENGSYRRVMKDTLEFDPEVLRRFVNFMSNPDERTAVDQFGKGDKYFGVCTLMATMPGLPMFGHGQVEGFAEKYGMEYRRAYYDEQPDGWLIERHEREIFPLLHRRWLFAGVADFLLYDFFDPGGWVNEDVFAYSNRAGDERGLVVYYNKFAEAKGWIKTSTAYSVPDGSGGRRQVQRSLGEGLGLHPDGEWFTLMREQRSGLEFIRRSSDLCRDGLFVELHAYGCQVFMEIREVADDAVGSWRALWERLDGAGVPDLEAARRRMQLEPLHAALRGFGEAGTLRRLAELGAARARLGQSPVHPLDLGLRGVQPPSTRRKAGKTTAGESATAGGSAEKPARSDASPQETARLLNQALEIRGVLAAAVAVTGSGGDVASAVERFRSDLEAALRLPELGDRLRAGLADEWTWGALFGKLVVSALDEVTTRRPEVAAPTTAPRPPASPGAGPHGAASSAAVTPAAMSSAAASPGSLDSLDLAPEIAELLRSLGLDEAASWRGVGIIRVLRTLPLPSFVASLDSVERGPAMVRALIADDSARAYMGVNVWQDVVWFNRESFDRLLWWMLALEGLAHPTAAVASKAVTAAERVTSRLAKAAEASGYQLDKLESAARD